MLRNVMRPPFDSSISKQPPIHARVDFLDTIRFIAASAVLFQHIVEIQGETGSKIAGLLSSGVFGVVLFFIVSGFVMPMAIKGQFKCSDFLLRRVFRIYPLVLTAFVVLALLAFCTELQPFQYARAANARDWVTNLLLIQDYTRSTPLWGVTWTLSLEVTWYALFAISTLVVGPRFDRYLSVLFPVFMVVIAAVSLLTEARAPIGRIGMIYAAAFGCRLYWLSKGEISRRQIFIDTAAFIATMSLCNAISFGYFKHPNITLMQALIPWIVAPAFFVLVVTIPSLRQAAFFRNPILRQLGAISFSIYLLHPFAIALAEAFYPQHGWEMSLVFTLIFAIAGYKFIELPGQALGRRLISWYHSRSSAAVTSHRL